MAIQMIFCVETNKRADTDSIYISETINHWYQVDNRIKLSKIHMNTKSRYNANAVVKEIDKKTKAFTIGETKVIYCIDTDQYETNAEHKNELDAICQYCRANGYDLIWFCHNVEEVFIGKKVSDSQKVQEAAAFRRQGRIKEIDAGKLSCGEKRACVSNIMNVLDQYLSRK